ncbi:MAG: bifunctional demethylmenaquinone methyltransferase/2-methoxy-6-polyprenyl-1,4-benzoquinol methylase UbiE [Coprobacter sp.]|nr:bifunctional demethylmenaquinone methyltransferase/2-methoxy-6-polyprenyl-1,4-benzoquinol methylase UbiE [Coprobacter sp.]
MTKYKAESILPYNGQEKKSVQIRQMFDAIAPSYDLLNRTMTWGIDRRWRKTAVKMLRTHAPEQILDIATGTGDLAFLMHRMLHPERITGADLSEGMLKIAQEKAAALGLQEDIVFENQDCLHLTYPDATFDAVTVAYGVRNFEELDRGFQEMYRVLRPGGILQVIELSTPEQFPFRQLYRFYSGTIIPVMGRLLSKDKKAYSYLPQSIAGVPQGEQMLDIFRRAGFQNARCTKLTFGVCSVYTGEK